MAHPVRQCAVALKATLFSEALFPCISVSPLPFRVPLVAPGLHLRDLALLRPHDLPGVDVILGPEMRSTGEVMGIDRDFASAFAKSQLGAGVKLPDGGGVFISVRDRDKPALIPIARKLADLGFT